MDLKNIRHLREILITDAKGKTISLMQYSSQNTSHFRPNFVQVPLPDQVQARELYVRWGGHRRVDLRIGASVTIPARPVEFERQKSRASDEPENPSYC